MLASKFLLPSAFLVIAGITAVGGRRQVPYRSRGGPVGTGTATG